MRKTITLTVLAAVILGGIACVAYAWQPAIDPITEPPAAASDQTLVAQGARVMALGDCMVCHTAKGGKPYAGGLPLDTPFGTIHSTNITPDPDTGIGTWSLEAFTRAMRRGVARDGHLLYPAFPYAHFTKMTDDDIGAAYAYLMARAPVSAPAPANDLIFPLNFRPLVAGWNLLFLEPGELPADDGSQTAEWTRGRYLVEGPGHCQACHTPMNILGAEKRSLAFAGNQIDGWDAPPLNALARAPKPWTKEQLVSYLRTGLASEHGAAAGPMLPVTQHLADVPEADVQAMATYLLAIQPQAGAADQPAAARAEANAADQGRIQNGAMLFAGSCVACHSAAAPMSTIGERPSLALSSAVNADSPRNVIRLILDGNPWQGSQSAHFMPGFGNSLTDEQIADVAAYLRGEYTQRPAWPALTDTVAKIRKETQSQ